MLQHTGRFWSRNSQQRTMWQHWSIPHTFLNWLQLIFTCSLDWNQRWMDGAFVVILTSLRMRRKSWKGLYKTASKNFSSTFTSRWRKGSILKEMSLKLLRCFAFLRNDVTLGTFWSYHVLYSGTAVAQWLRCCATNRKVAGSIPAGVSGFFIDIKSFRSHYGPGVDSASNRNEYQEYLLGVKAAGA